MDITYSVTDQIWSDFKEARKISFHARYFYIRILQGLCDYARAEITDIDAVTANGYLRSLSSTSGKAYAPSTIDRTIRTLKSVGAFIEENQDAYGLGAYTSPFRLLSFVSDGTSSIHVPDLTEISAFLTLAREQDPAVFIAATLALKNALATSEIVSLVRASFRFLEPSSVRISGGAFKKRTLPLTDDVKEVIFSLCEGFDEADLTAPLLTTRLKAPMSARVLQKRVKNISEQLDSPVTLMDIRSFAIVELLRVNDEASVAAYTGMDGRWLFQYLELLKDDAFHSIVLPHIEVTA